MKENSPREPYALLFISGILSAVFGALIWLLFRANLIGFYPRQAHANLMFAGFLWAFVAGFLMTAIPKMTGTSAASNLEKYLAGGLVFLQWVLNFQNHIALAVGLYGLQLGFLLYFVLRRFVKRKQMPFEGFIFLPFAFVCGLLGVGIYFYNPNQYSTFAFIAGQGLLLNLICGIGSRLIPVLCRLPQAVQPDVAGQNRKLQEMIFFALWLNLSFLLEALSPSTLTTLAMVLRFAFFAVYGIRHFRILQKPTLRSYLGWGLRLSIVLLALGYLLAAIWSDQLLPLLHLSFISGIASLTFMVATRVTLAHGGASLNIELENPIPLIAAAFFAVAGGLRLIIGSDIASPLLTLAIVAFLLGVGLWSLGIGRYLVSRGKA